MIEVHYDPSEVLVDAQQAIAPDELKEVVAVCREIHYIIAKNKRKG